MMTLDLCMIPLKKILEINYTCVSMTQPMEIYILWRVTIFFIYQKMDERGRVFIAKGRRLEGKNILQR